MRINPKTSTPPAPQFVGKLFSTKPIPGTKKGTSGIKDFLRFGNLRTAALKIIWGGIKVLVPVNCVTVSFFSKQLKELSFQSHHLKVIFLVSLLHSS